MKASPAEQRILLDVADIDRRIQQAEAKRIDPAKKARIAELQARRSAELHDFTNASGARDDIKTEIARIEGDVEIARQRQTRDRDRLAASTDPKQAVALENEIASLARRLSELEDLELAAMDRLEEAEKIVANRQVAVEATNTEGAALTAEAREAVENATKEIDTLKRDRAAVSEKVSAPLLAQYDRIASRGAIGAGLLRGGMCEACNIVLPTTDLAEVRAAGDDEIVNCPECGAILVRTEESGL